MKKILTSPYDLVAEALDIKKELLSEDSSMGETPNWDSLNHLDIITALETNYEISISDKDVMKYDNMRAIIALYEKKIGIQKPLEKLVDRLKESKIGKVFGK